jgi:hypothetical protein
MYNHNLHSLYFSDIIMLQNLNYFIIIEINLLLSVLLSKLFIALILN